MWRRKALSLCALLASCVAATLVSAPVVSANEDDTNRRPSLMAQLVAPSNGGEIGHELGARNSTTIELQAFDNGPISAEAFGCSVFFLDAKTITSQCDAVFVGLNEDNKTLTLAWNNLAGQQRYLLEPLVRNENDLDRELGTLRLFFDHCEPTAQCSLDTSSTHDVPHSSVICADASNAILFYNAFFFGDGPPLKVSEAAVGLICLSNNGAEIVLKSSGLGSVKSSTYIRTNR